MFLPGDKLCLHQFFQGVVNGMLIFYMEYKAYINQLFFAVSVIDIVQYQNIERAEI